MKKNLWLICLMVFVCIFSSAVLWAQEKKTDAKLDPKEMVNFSKEVALFSQLVSVGQANKDSLIIISAVRILDSLPFDGVAKPGADDKSFDRKGLLNEAKEYAYGDQEVLAVIAKLMEVPETTDVRGHGGHHGGYHGGGYRHDHYRHHCFWHYVCGPFGCEWVCN